MITIIITVIAAILVLFLIIAALKPAEFRIARQANIAAPMDLVFAQVNDLHRFQDWSPWAKIDPNATLTYEGPLAGPGAIFRWQGNREVGEGSMTITERQPGHFIRMQLDFLKPFKATHTAEFTFEPKNADTEVTWAMSGRNNFLFRAIGLFMNCDKMIGGQFEKGLANLKALVEGTNEGRRSVEGGSGTIELIANPVLS